MADTNTTPQTAPDNGRDANGRFAKGNTFGMGNPFAREVAHMRKRAMHHMTDEVIDRIVLAMIGKAEKGDVSAAKFLFSYSIGKPGPSVEPDNLDTHEWQIFRDQTDMVKEMNILAQWPGPELPLRALRGMRPAQTDIMINELAGMVHESDAAEAKKAEQARKRKEKREAKKQQATQEGLQVSAKRQADRTAEEAGVHGSGCDKVGVHASAYPEDEDTVKREHQLSPSPIGSNGQFAPSPNGDTVDDEVIAKILALLEREDLDLPPSDTR